MILIQLTYGEEGRNRKTILKIKQGIGTKTKVDKSNYL